MINFMVLLSISKYTFSNLWHILQKLFYVAKPARLKALPPKLNDNILLTL